MKNSNNLRRNNSVTIRSTETCDMSLERGERGLSNGVSSGSITFIAGKIFKFVCETAVCFSPIFFPVFDKFMKNGARTLIFEHDIAQGPRQVHTKFEPNRMKID